MAMARMLHCLVCAWSSDTPPTFQSFFPAPPDDGDGEIMDESQILVAFGIRTP